eukprot:c2008_g1_i1.p1 GENE.c2008_g1_i1~~c2008_g1_i1.p1  ORF type:complete len:225 (+),score=49.05 c2008_g1_i1:40-675(+)
MPLLTALCATTGSVLLLATCSIALSLVSLSSDLLTIKCADSSSPGAQFQFYNAHMNIIDFRQKHHIFQYTNEMFETEAPTVFGEARKFETNFTLTLFSVCSSFLLLVSTIYSWLRPTSRRHFVPLVFAILTTAASAVGSMLVYTSAPVRDESSQFELCGVLASTFVGLGLKCQFACSLCGVLLVALSMLIAQSKQIQSNVKFHRIQSEEYL